MYIQTQTEDKDSPHWQALREAVRRHKNLNQAHDMQLPEAVGVYSFGPDRKDSRSLHRRAAAAKRRFASDSVNTLLHTDTGLLPMTSR